MNIKSLLAAAAVAALAAGSTAAKADMIVNGGFETGDTTGWTINDPTTNTGAIESGSSDSAGIITAHSGKWLLGLGNSSSQYPYGTVSQTIADHAGDALTLSYWFFTQGGTPNYFDATWNGATLAGSVIQNADAMGWTQFIYAVTATGSDTLLFHEQNVPNFSGLDDVSLNAPPQRGVPEPTALSLLGLALTALGLKRRRA